MVVVLIRGLAGGVGIRPGRIVRKGANLVFPVPVMSPPVLMES